MHDPLYGQFTLARSRAETPPGFRGLSCNGWHLHAHPALPVHDVVDPDDRRIGFLLGYVIRDGQLQLEASKLSLPRADKVDAPLVEDCLRTLSGRYLLLLLTGRPGKNLAYPDPVASLSAVFSASAEKLSSTTSMLSYREGCRMSYPVDEFPDDAPNRFYPAGLTDREDGRRLLPNHRLDLDTWQVARFWPAAALEPDLESAADHYLGIAVDRIRDNMTAAGTGEGPVYSPLTAGRDSRLMLACSPSWLRDRTTYVTLRFRSDRLRHRRDLHIGRILARRNGLRHKVVTVLPASQEDRERYFYAIGRAGGTGKARKFYRTPLERLDMRGIWLNGFGGALAKRRYAIDGDGSSRPGPADLLRCCRLPPRPHFLAAVDRWLACLPASVSEDLVPDLFYMEMRLGAWAGPHMYGIAPFRASLTPFADRRFAEACFALPVRYRQSMQASADMIQSVDPQLLDVPFEQLTGRARLWRRVMASLPKLTRSFGSM